MSSWTAVLRLVGFVATLALALLVVAGNDGAARAMASENNNASAGPFLPDVCAQAQASLLHLQNVNTDASTGEFSQPNQPACVCFFFSSLLRALIIHPIHGTPLLTSPPRFSPLLSLSLSHIQTLTHSHTHTHPITHTLTHIPSPTHTLLFQQHTGNHCKASWKQSVVPKSRHRKSDVQRKTAAKRPPCLPSAPFNHRCSCPAQPACKPHISSSRWLIPASHWSQSPRSERASFSVESNQPN